MKSNRLDQELVTRSLAQSREEAKRLILAGEVLVSGHVADKPAIKVNDESQIIVKERPKYVSRGGLKLERAIEEFDIDVKGKIALDIGSSTGGFTDCLLQNGALKVYAFDVGTNQLAWKLRQDARVVVREQFNCRNLTIKDLGQSPDIIVADVSFISLTKLLDPAVGTLSENGDLVVLIKPQFELQREQVSRGGIVKDPGLHRESIDKVISFASDKCGMKCMGQTESPIKGASGNIEFLAWLRHS
jgi:23S rRNA (cytidine1920-2'-O)/16S rRNA (cytidine1409-2'-O)-methyltransferase